MHFGRSIAIALALCVVFFVILQPPPGQTDENTPATGENSAAMVPESTGSAADSTGPDGGGESSR